MTTTCDRTDRLLSSYRLNMDRGSATVRRMILEDIGRLSEMGAQAYVDDLRKALSRFDGARDDGVRGHVRAESNGCM